MYMYLKPYILIRSCRCKEATLQTIDASSNCWPSVEGELTLDLTSGQNPRAKFKRSIIQAVGEVKFPEQSAKECWPSCNTLEPTEVEIVEDCHPCSKTSQLRKSIKVSGQGSLASPLGEERKSAELN